MSNGRRFQLQTGAEFLLKEREKNLRTGIGFNPRKLEKASKDLKAPSPNLSSLKKIASLGRNVPQVSPMRFKDPLTSSITSQKSAIVTHRIELEKNGEQSPEST